MFGCRSIPRLDSPPSSPEWIAAILGTTVHRTPPVPVKARSDSQAALR